MGPAVKGSSDDGAGQVSPELLSTLVRLADISTLGRSERDPWTGDVDQANSMAGEFGTVALPIVRGEEVVWGWEHVAAEQDAGRFGGQLLVVDVTELDWPEERVWALVSGLRRGSDLTLADDVLLAELLTQIREGHADWLHAAGWSDDALEDLLAEISVPSLNDLEDQHGAYHPDDDKEFWPWIKVQVSPDTFQRWQVALEDAPGRNDAEKAEHLFGGLLTLPQ